MGASHILGRSMDRCINFLSQIPHGGGMVLVTGVCSI
jgi:hypothetical protein